MPQAIWTAISREASLAAQHIGVGATALGRANYAAPALYSQAFFALSVGFERTSKLALALDHLVEHGGTFPSGKDLKDYGHDIGRLVKSIDAIVERRALGSQCGAMPSSDIHAAIVITLGEFARNVTRYYNLELLAAGDGGLKVDDPIAAWYRRVIVPVLKSHYSDARRLRDEAAADAKEVALGPYAIIRFVHESGQIISSLGAATLATRRSEAARPWERMYVLQVGRYLGGVVSELGRLARAHGYEVPYIDEMFSRFNQEDRELRTRKVWTVD